MFNGRVQLLFLKVDALDQIPIGKERIQNIRQILQQLCIEKNTNPFNIQTDTTVLLAQLGYLEVEP